MVSRVATIVFFAAYGLDSFLGGPFALIAAVAALVAAIALLANA